MEDKRLKFADLFAGIGGFRLAFEKADYDCVFSCEINEACQKVYYNNFAETTANDIRKINVQSLPYFDVLTAGFPCQPFSICGRRKGFQDTRGTLFFHICEIIEYIHPPVVVLENVKHLLHHDKGRTLEVILYSLEDLGYIVNYELLNSKDFGLPQNRERVVFVATKDQKFDFTLLKKTDPFPNLRTFLCTSGKFEYLNPQEYTLIDNPKQQSSGLIFVGYRNKNIWKTGIRPNTEHLSRVHHQPNRIYSIDGVHPTIPSQETSGRFFIYIPEENKVRKLTLRECYRIMGFPDSFKTHSNLAECYKQIGNSVAIPVMYELANQIKEQVFLHKNIETEIIKFNKTSGLEQPIQLEIPLSMNHREKLLQIYQATSDIEINQIQLPEEYQNYVAEIAQKCFARKAVHTVLITLLVHKILNPSQDIRYHQTDMPGGFSGRSIDTKYITPTLTELGLPAMAESGWLTRSFEQPYPYTLNYNGNITPKSLKTAFLNIVDFVQTHPEKCEDVLKLLIKLITSAKNDNLVEIVKLTNPEKVDIRNVVNALDEHFNYNYKTDGGSKLPVIAFYAIYQILVREISRYNSCTLKTLGSHTASDRTSKTAGDIEIFDKNSHLVEAIEVKHGQEITLQMVYRAKGKIIKHNPGRYYIFASKDIKQSEADKIDDLVKEIATEHGCQVILNGIIPTIKYYLRLIMSITDFIDGYSKLIESDNEIQKVHKEKWNEILSRLIIDK
ncbi:DNA cytosine methyltransferase [Anabaena azotica]|uniref:Cytosine-specific methyltransferase n=1 Tax=Anabaena azotica FACHB-119 TaxID=947527 RepID=A0ABR8D7K3_9NOST|nr:DNA cytosine methyltransferase [Anabaena azotica]MBD2501728.1 DNA (cytosine-5-)-methyltransferase [Anabaena azotica FACHB-119]